MSYLFLDESGDLGFDFTKDKTTKYFIITCLFADNKRPIEKVVRKVHRTLRRTHIRKSGGIIHAYREDDVTRQRTLKWLNEKECIAMAIYLNKSKVYTTLQEEQTILYNYVTNILLDRIFSRNYIKTDSVQLVASKRETNKFLNENFTNYVTKQINKNNGSKVQVVIKTPHQEKGLQAVDFISWAIFRKYEYGDDSYYNLIKESIVEENALFN